MNTISTILEDIDRKCMINNLNENAFSYRIVFFINESGKSTKHYIDTGYCGLRQSLENIIRENISLTNSVVIAAITVLRNRKCIPLQSRAYSFNLNGYFRQINGKCQDDNMDMCFMRGNMRNVRLKMGNHLITSRNLNE